MVVRDWWGGRAGKRREEKGAGGVRNLTLSYIHALGRQEGRGRERKIQNPEYRSLESRTPNDEPTMVSAALWFSGGFCGLLASLTNLGKSPTPCFSLFNFSVPPEPPPGRLYSPKISGALWLVRFSG